MLWIGLAILFFILMVVTIILMIVNFYDGEILGASVFLFVIFLIPAIITAYSGSTDYPTLQAKYKSVLLMRERINDVRNSYYKSEAKNAIVAGNIENIKQSTILSDAVRSLTEKETEYIAERERVIFAKNSWIYKIFLDGLFISDKVNTLPELKVISYDWK